jgi:hypothetical protein
MELLYDIYTDIITIFMPTPFSRTVKPGEQIRIEVEIFRAFTNVIFRCGPIWQGLIPVPAKRFITGVDGYGGYAETESDRDSFPEENLGDESVTVKYIMKYIDLITDQDDYLGDVSLDDDTVRWDWLYLDFCGIVGGGGDLDPTPAYEGAQSSHRILTDFCRRPGQPEWCRSWDPACEPCCWIAEDITQKANQGDTNSNENPFPSPIGRIWVPDDDNSDPPSTANAILYGFSVAGPLLITAKLEKAKTCWIEEDERSEDLVLTVVPVGPEMTEGTEEEYEEAAMQHRVQISYTGWTRLSHTPLLNTTVADTDPGFVRWAARPIGEQAGAPTEKEFKVTLAYMCVRDPETGELLKEPDPGSVEIIVATGHNCFTSPLPGTGTGYNTIAAGLDLVESSKNQCPRDFCCEPPPPCESQPSILCVQIEFDNAECSGSLGQSLVSLASYTRPNGCCYWEFTAGPGNQENCNEGGGFEFLIRYCPSNGQWHICPHEYWDDANDVVTGARDRCTPEQCVRLTVTGVYDTSTMPATNTLTLTAEDVPFDGCAKSLAKVTLVPGNTIDGNGDCVRF